MATFVLVHGAFLGGWAFARLTPLLRAAGHEVYTPTLTGAGERTHLLGPNVGLELHVEDVVNVLRFEDLRDVILVGHSYAGLVITCAADRARDRVREIVYLDGHIASQGLNSMGTLSEGTADKLDAMSAAEGPRLLPPIPLEGMGIHADADREWVTHRLVAHPMKCLEDPVRFQNGDPAVPRSYIYCTDRKSLVSLFGVDPLATYVERAKREGYHFYEINSGHSPMVTHPRELAEILGAIASRRSAV